MRISPDHVLATLRKDIPNPLEEICSLSRETQYAINDIGDAYDHGRLSEGNDIFHERYKKLIDEETGEPVSVEAANDRVMLEHILIILKELNYRRQQFKQALEPERHRN